MTIQMNDAIIYHEKIYSLAGINGQGLFDPSEHGAKPCSFSTPTNNMKAYSCTYLVKDQLLLLDEMTMGVGYKDVADECPQQSAPPIFGVQPETSDLFSTATYHFKQPIQFTGELLLADDRAECPNHLRAPNGVYISALFYHEVHELVFRDGVMVKEEDCSARVAELREELISNTPPHSELTKFPLMQGNLAYHW